ncbi:MAG: hypothetical protein H7070_03525 [Saprospiraceae bacterium]|nr:hypothetical protein [Pyrinomonadaceae bacterium]
MSIHKTKNPGFKTFSSSSKIDGSDDRASLKPRTTVNEEAAGQFSVSDREIDSSEEGKSRKQIVDETSILETSNERREALDKPSIDQLRQRNKISRLIRKDQKLLNNDSWSKRKGHTLTYAGVFLFTLTLYFRPYELIPALSALSSMAMILAVVTLVVYVPTQLSIESSLTILTTEVKCILFLAFWAVLTIPIAKNPGLAWETFNETLSKVVIIFVIMVNTLRTKLRLKGLMWLAIGVGVMLSYQALDLYQKGEFATEGYRVSVDFGGMFGNPNDMAGHLVIFMPVAVVLGLASKKKLAKLMYFVAAGMMVAGNMVTQSRGGFLGLITVAAVLVWKIGKNQRLKSILISGVLALIIIALAPGNYGIRMLSIFVPALDSVGSSDQRTELLKQSFLVTLRNPLGIGLGNFPIVGTRNLETHNAFTQVSAELGWLAFAAYMIFMISPWRKLAAIERQIVRREDNSWIYLTSIGLQASIAGYMVSSFFGSVAYQWYIYYPIAFAVCLRRIYQTEYANDQILETSEIRSDGTLKLQKA